MQQPRDPKSGQWLQKQHKDNSQVLRAVGYVRVSTEEQVKHGLSLQAQEEQIRGHVALHNKSPLTEKKIDLIDVLAERGKSAKTIRNRPVFQQIMKMAEEGDIDAVVIWRLDRLFRNILNQVNTMDRWKKWGIELIATDDMIDTTKASGRLWLNMSGSINQFYSDVTGERVRLVKDDKVKRLEYAGGDPPLGWQIAEKLGPRGKRMLEPNVNELEVLEVIEQLNDQGNSINQITKELEKRRFKNRAGKYTWSTKTVWKAIIAAENGFAEKSRAAVSPADKS